MSHLNRENRSEAREVAWLLSHLAERATSISQGEFLGIWRTLEPRVLCCLRSREQEEGTASGSIERLRNLTWEVAVSADIEALHCAALRRLAQLFNERVERTARRSSSDAEPMGVFGIG